MAKEKVKVRSDSYLRAARLAFGLSLAQVASAMGCSPPAVWELEQRPLLRVRASTLERYHAALGAADRKRSAARHDAGQALIEALELAGQGAQ